MVRDGLGNAEVSEEQQRKSACWRNGGASDGALEEGEGEEKREEVEEQCECEDGEEEEEAQGEEEDEDGFEEEGEKMRQCGFALRARGLHLHERVDPVGLVLPLGELLHQSCSAIRERSVKIVAANRHD